MKNLIFVILFFSSALFAGSLTCNLFYDPSFLPSEKVWQQTAEVEKQAFRRQHMMLRDPEGPAIERRPKKITSGDRKDAVDTMDPADVRIDTADPSLVMPITYPNGTTKYRINFSGLRYIEADSIADLFKGGIRHVQRSRGFYADGTEMVGPYHNASWPWDVVIYKNDHGENIALGGVMKQPAPGVLPNVAEHNPTRSRWWGKVKHIEIAPGVYEEHIIWQGPVHDFNNVPTVGWQFHGYGGTLMTQFDRQRGEHVPVKNKNGNYLLFYERVVEEKVEDSGYRRPWVTNLFVREMDPSLKFTVGKETSVTSVISPVTHTYFKATVRGPHERPEGYLAEGGNVLKEISRGSLLKMFSGNDYVARYGIYMDYLPKNSPATSMFKPVLDAKGELVDFAETMNLREIFNATWLGRPQMEYDPNGQLWLRFHFVDISTIPKGGPVQGWPTAEQFLHYARTSAQIPVKIVYDSAGTPGIVMDIDPRFEYLYK
jgi:hypothetical protein